MLVKVDVVDHHALVFYPLGQLDDLTGHLLRMLMAAAGGPLQVQAEVARRDAFGCEIGQWQSTTELGWR